MTKPKKHLLFSLIAIVVTIIAYSLFDAVYGSGPGFCCGVPARPSIKHLDDYLAGIEVLGFIAFIIGNAVIFFRNKKN